MGDAVLVQRVCFVGDILIRHPYDEDVLIGTLHIVLLTSHLLKCLGVIVQTLELACGSIETLLVVGYLAPEFGNPLPTAAPDEQAVVIEKANDKSCKQYDEHILKPANEVPD